MTELPEPSPPVEPGRRTPRQLRRVVGARRWLRRVGIAVAVLATLAAGEAIIRTEPEHYDNKAPHYFAGEPDQPVTAGNLRVTLLGVDGAAVVDPPDSLATDTGGVWVVARVRLEATEETISVGYAGVAARDGRTFRASERFGQDLIDGKVALQPGIPVVGEVAFELPKGVTGLTLRVGTSDPTFVSELRLPAYTDIRMPVADDDLARWSSVKEPLKLAESKVDG
jgi:hypothetical protein